MRYRFVLVGAATGRGALQRTREADENPIRAYFSESQQLGLIRGDLPLRWVMSTFQALCLVATQDVVAGHTDQPAAAALLAESLIAVLLEPAART